MSLDLDSMLPEGVSVVGERAYFEGECIGTITEHSRGFRGVSLDKKTKASGNVRFAVLLVLKAGLQAEREKAGSEGAVKP